MITGAWLLWVQGSTVLDCAALARFVLNDSSMAPLLQLSFYLVPPILVQLICTVASGPVLARLSGERWLLPVSLKHAFWHEPVTIWPLFALLAGVACFTLFNEVRAGPDMPRRFLRSPRTARPALAAVSESEPRYPSVRRAAIPHHRIGPKSRRHD